MQTTTPPVSPRHRRASRTPTTPSIHVHTNVLLNSASRTPSQTPTVCDNASPFPVTPRSLVPRPADLLPAPVNASKFYAVTVAQEVGIFYNWTDVKSRIRDVSDPVQERCSDYQEAFAVYSRAHQAGHVLAVPVRGGPFDQPQHSSTIPVRRPPTSPHVQPITPIRGTRRAAPIVSTTTTLRDNSPSASRVSATTSFQGNGSAATRIHNGNAGTTSSVIRVVVISSDEEDAVETDYGSEDEAFWRSVSDMSLGESL